MCESGIGVMKIALYEFSIRFGLYAQKCSTKSTKCVVGVGVFVCVCVFAMVHVTS